MLDSKRYIRYSWSRHIHHTDLKPVHHARLHSFPIPPSFRCHPSKTKHSMPPKANFASYGSSILPMLPPVLRFSLHKHPKKGILPRSAHTSRLGGRTAMWAFLQVSYAIRFLSPSWKSKTSRACFSVLIGNFLFWLI